MALRDEVTLWYWHVGVMSLAWVLVQVDDLVPSLVLKLCLYIDICVSSHPLLGPVMQV